jgi:hypothetical protein
LEGDLQVAISLYFDPANVLGPKLVFWGPGVRDVLKYFNNSTQPASIGLKPALARQREGSERVCS